MADSARTEQPTQRRLERARREGNFPASREFITSIHFFGFVALLAVFSAILLNHLAVLVRTILAQAFSADLTVESVTAITRGFAGPALTPILLSGGLLTALAIFAQLATTKMGVSLKKLAPDFNRLNPINRLRSLPAQNFPLLIQALLILPIVGAVVWLEVSENLNSFLELPWMGPQPAAWRIGRVIGTLLWRVAGMFLVVGVADLLWQRRRYMAQLRMTKQEVREEIKEQEANPQMRARVRRIQRDVARRKMMQNVATATAVVVNPTHYAVALRYSLEIPGAPRVVAKGKNYLAARIRQRAIENQVPIIENPPLARALYSAADVGQEIPSHLYRAVAEVLAYIYKLMNGRLPGGG